MVIDRWIAGGRRRRGVSRGASDGYAAVHPRVRIPGRGEGVDPARSV